MNSIAAGLPPSQLESSKSWLSDLNGPMAEFLTAVSTLRRTFNASDSAGLGHLEESLKKPTGDFLAAALERAAQEKADATPPLCPKCRTKLIELRITERKVQTAFGQISLKRLTGRCRKCKTRVCPADEALGLEKGYSPAVQESAALLASKMPVADAAAVLQRLTGLEMSPTTLHRIAKESGQKAKIKRKKADDQARQGSGLGDVPAPKTLVLMLDAWNVRERDQWGNTETLRKRGQEPQRWHWVWTGTVFSLDACAQKGDRPIIAQRGYAATREGTAALSEQLHAEALRQGLGKAERVLVMGDGASWIWNIARDRFSEAVQRIDLYHVQEHLWALSRELHGETAETKPSVERMKKQLRKGQAAKMIAAVEKQLGAMDTPQKTAVEKELRYFREHQARMSYDQADQRNEPCGSGAIESTCRQYQCRFKRPGQFWSTEGDEALLCLDTFWRNARWSFLFPHILGLQPSRN